MKSNLKVVLSAVALAALVAAPAVAKSRTQHQTGQIPAYSHNEVIQDGKVLGTDPDANIRGQILRDGNSFLND